MKTKTRKTEIVFDAGELLARVEGYAAGTHPARERVLKIPHPVKAISPKQIVQFIARSGKASPGSVAGGVESDPPTNKSTARLVTFPE